MHTKLLISLSVLVVSVASLADDFVRYSKEAAKVVRSDRCAQVAVDAVISSITESIENAGGDMPDSIMIETVDVNDEGRFYSVTPADSGTFTVTTRRYGSGCKALDASEVKPEPAVTRSN